MSLELYIEYAAICILLASIAYLFYKEELPYRSKNIIVKHIYIVIPLIVAILFVMYINPITPRAKTVVLLFAIGIYYLWRNMLRSTIEHKNNKKRNILEAICKGDMSIAEGAQKLGVTEEKMGKMIDRY